jgi:hydrogenase maturation protease
MKLSTESIAIIAYGNPSRGDDGVGPLLIQQLQNEKFKTLYRVNYIEDLQLNPEHVIDLQHIKAVIFVDAAHGLSRSYNFYRLRPKHNSNFSSHIQSPENILNLFEATINKNAPLAYMLAIRGTQFALDAAMSKDTAKSVRKAKQFIINLLQKPLVDWEHSIDQIDLSLRYA